MPSRSIAPKNAWASAFVGGTFFLLAGLLPRNTVSLALLGQLLWLGLVGSVPTTLVLVGADHVSRARRGVLVASSILVALLSLAMGWEHTDFLLSGPRWASHPQRALVRAAMGLGLGLAGAAGWCWLVLGARAKAGLRVVAWVGLSLVCVVGMTALMVRHRAYDYSMAQLVFPAGTLCGAIVYLLTRGSRGARVVLALAVAGLLFGVGSRLDAGFASKGKREAIAQSRAGALAMLYVLPHFTSDAERQAGGVDCPEPKPVVLTSPIDIPAESRRNVIIVTVDALRSDVVGMQVEGRPVTPSLTRLQESGLRFTNATSTYPATLFAVGSAFTGLTPAELYLHPSLPETIFTRSRGVVDSQLAVLPDVSWFRLPIVGQFLASGVETVLAKTDAAATTVFLERLDAARRDGSSVMAWIHYYAPHDPYRTQPGLSFGAGKKNAYLSEVASFDRELGRLLDHLDRNGWLEDTLVVFFSDHGEALGEKAYWGHHVYLDAWMIDVPLVLWHAGLRPSVSAAGVSLADVAPTVFHFLGLPVPRDMPATSLFMVSPDRPGRTTFSEAFPVRGRALFDGFRLPALDDATITERLQSIRTTSRGYEPKVAITSDRHRLVHHRGSDVTLLYERRPMGEQSRALGASDDDTRLRLKAELEKWEDEQQRRIRCRLKFSAEPPSTPRRQ